MTAGVATPLHTDRSGANDHRCATCGYQISTSKPFPACPMCGGRDWQSIASSRQAHVNRPFDTWEAR